MLGLLAEGQEGHVDFHTTCEEMDLNVCGSSEDTRHKTIPKIKNLMSLVTSPGREGGAEKRNKPSADLGSCPEDRPSLFVEGHLAFLSLIFLICKVEPTMPALNVW